MKALSARGISFRYGSHMVFDNASLELDAGSVAGLVGANGAGKTTFFDLACGLREPSAGQLLRRCPHPLYLSQTLSTSPALRLGELFELVAHLNHARRPRRAQVIAQLQGWSPALAERVERLWHKRPGQCSYGQVRYFFALALLCHPGELVLLDEPTAGVDPEHRHYLWQCVHAARAAGTAVLVASHHIEEVARHTEGFWLLHQCRFEHFASGAAFQQRFGGESLDEAFIAAVQRQ